MRIKFTEDWVNEEDGRILNEVGSILHINRAMAQKLAYEDRIAEIIEETPGTQMSQIDHLEKERELNRGKKPEDRKQYEYPSFTY